MRKAACLIKLDPYQLLNQFTVPKTVYLCPKELKFASTLAKAELGLACIPCIPSKPC